MTLENLNTIINIFIFFQGVYQFHGGLLDKKTLERNSSFPFEKFIVNIFFWLIAILTQQSVTIEIMSLIKVSSLSTYKMHL